MKKFWMFVGMIIMLSSAVMAGNRAETTSKSKEQNMTVLVHHLIQGEKRPEEQAKTIAIWIASHIAYDNYSLQTMQPKRGQRVSRRLEKGDQDADSVFKNKIGTCEGYANLYEKMLNIARIPNEQVHGFVLERQSGLGAAKRNIKKEEIGHVWNKVKVRGKPALLVDVTFMSRGKAGNKGNTRLTPYMRDKEIRDIQKSHSTYKYNMDYFDFDYKDLQRQGEFRFDIARQVLKK